MAVLTYAARIALAQYIISRPIHLAIGEGDPNWGTVPDPPEYTATKLVKEIGRKKNTRAFFVNENDNGEIDMPGGRRYSYSDSPTRQIYFHFIFNFGEGIAVPIREVGIFMDTVTNANLPQDQTYFEPHEITKPGTLLLLEHLDTADTFTPNKKGSYGTILTV